MLVGIIANPSAGKDIRRIVAQGRFVPNHEKVNILKRVLSGLGASPAKQVVMMPDSGKLSYAAAQNISEDLKIDFLDGDTTNHKLDNIQMLCYNCYFLQVGNLNGRNKE